MSFIRIKICCISSVEEANLAIKYGADALGFVSAMPSGAGIIDEELIPQIVSHVPPQSKLKILFRRFSGAIQIQYNWSIV